MPECETLKIILQDMWQVCLMELKSYYQLHNPSVKIFERSFFFCLMTYTSWRKDFFYILLHLTSNSWQEQESQRSSNYSQNSHFFLSFPTFSAESHFDLCIKIMKVTSYMLVGFLLKIIWVVLCSVIAIKRDNNTRLSGSRSIWASSSYCPSTTGWDGV